MVSWERNEVSMMAVSTGPPGSCVTNSRAMRFLLALALTAACGGHRTSTSTPPTPPPEIAPGFPAARWVPATPTYVIAARTVGDGQRAIRDIVDSLGMVAGASSGDLSAVLARVLAVDPLNPDPVGGIGVDVAGGLVMFSDGVDPTFVVHLDAPDLTQAFFDHQRKLGMVTRSVVVDAIEMFTAKLTSDVDVSWAVDKDWLWVHFALTPTHDDSTAWFTGSHHPQPATWAAQWSWATTFGDALPTKVANVVGFVDVRELLAKLAPRLAPAVACTRLLDPIQRIGLAVEADGTHSSGRIALDLGDSAHAITDHLLPPPPGWATTVAGAPLVAQWNLDLPVVTETLSGCAGLFGVDLGVVRSTKVRAARAMVKAFDLDDKAFTGAVSLDVTSSQMFRDLLDIPGRSLFEKKRTFGAYTGHSLSVPTYPTIDYVLDDHVVLAASAGLLDKIATGPAPAGGVPVLAIDVTPSGMTAATWERLLDAAHAPEPRALVGQLSHWRDGHLGIVVDHGALIVEASGTRR
jgi:hypothetical protein